MLSFPYLSCSPLHRAVGAVMGFALVYGSWDGVLWHQETGAFPYTKGFLPVVLSWFFSPIIGAVLAAIIFFLSRLCILRRENSAQKAIWYVKVLLRTMKYPRRRQCHLVPMTAHHRTPLSSVSFC